MLKDVEGIVDATCYAVIAWSPLDVAIEVKALLDRMSGTHPPLTVSEDVVKPVACKWAINSASMSLAFVTDRSHRTVPCCNDGLRLVATSYHCLRPVLSA